jgi:hypothetical protein
MKVQNYSVTVEVSDEYDGDLPSDHEIESALMSALELDDEKFNVNSNRSMKVYRVQYRSAVDGYKR